jgi:hypothetical protein
LKDLITLTAAQFSLADNRTVDTKASLVYPEQITERATR